MKKICWQVSLILILFTFSNETYASIAYISDTDNGQLLSYNLSTNELDVVGDFVLVKNISGLAYNPQNGVMYGISAATDSLYSINLLTGRANLIGSFEAYVMHGLAYDITTNRLYATDPEESSLYIIDTITGMAHFVTHTTAQISGLAVDPETGILYGSPASQSAYSPRGLFIIDKITGSASKIGTTDISYNGLAFDPTTNILFGVRNIDDSLYSINKANADRILYAHLSATNSFN